MLSIAEAAGPGRFILGFGTSKIFLNNAGIQTNKTLGPMRDAVEIVRGVLRGEAFDGHNFIKSTLGGAGSDKSKQVARDYDLEIKVGAVYEGKV